MSAIGDLNSRLDTIDEKIDSLVNINGKNLLDNKDMMHLLKVTDRCLIRWRKKGYLPSIKIGGKVFFKASEIQQFINQESIKQKNHGK